MKKSLIMVILLSGCASPGIDRADQNQVVKRYYASVESMQKVTLSSEVGTGIAAGEGEFTVIQKKKLDKNTKCVLVNAANKVTLSTTDTSICEKSIK